VDEDVLFGSRQGFDSFSLHCFLKRLKNTVQDNIFETYAKLKRIIMKRDTFQRED